MQRGIFSNFPVNCSPLCSLSVFRLFYLLFLISYQLPYILSDGKVKVVVQFKGREMQHKELGRDLLQKIFQPIEDIAAMESTPKVRDDWRYRDNE